MIDNKAYDFCEAVGAADALTESSLKKARGDIGELTGYVSRSRGKALRSKIVLASSADENGRIPGDAVKLAAAIEILHLATLVHDDVIDDADLRRGEQSVQSRYGKRRAVILGDYLLTLSLKSVGDLREKYDNDRYRGLASEFFAILHKICLGELRQFRNNNNLTLVPIEYMKIISGKTAALFKLSAAAGAVAGNAERSELTRLKNFGYNMGMMFQIIDDCKDYESKESSAKKTVQSDIEQGVITLPLILAMNDDPKICAGAESVIFGGANPKDFCREVVDAGGTKKSMALALKFYEKAKKFLDNTGNNARTALLSDILEKSAQDCKIGITAV